MSVPGFLAARDNVRSSMLRVPRTATTSTIGLVMSMAVRAPSWVLKVDRR